MKYLGGKSRIAKGIVRAIVHALPADVKASDHDFLWWDPFCGGLSVSCELATTFGPGLVSDGHRALIFLYEAAASGWEPPTSVSRADYDNAASLPDSSPIKAFIGFGCAYSGAYFNGFYGATQCPPSSRHPKGMGQDPARAAAAALKRDVGLINASGSYFCHLDFLDIGPATLSAAIIYCGPPYAGTRSYAGGGLAPFDHSRFWAICQQRAVRSHVFVSELSCPIPHVEVWSRPYEKRLGARGQQNGAKVEKLFKILPMGA